MQTISSARFLAALLIISFISVLFLFAPYVSVFVLAIVFGVIFEPVYDRLNRYLPSFIAAVLTTALVVTIIAGPVAFVVTQVVQEAANVLISLQNGGGDTQSVTSFLQARINEWAPAANINLASYTQSVLSWVVGQAGSIFSSVLTVGLNIFLAIIALVYWFKDSMKLRSAVLRVSPLTSEDTHNILNALAHSIHSVITGTLVVAAVQGVVAGIGFYIFGVPNAFLWGSIAGICALLPMLGATIITGPMVLFLFFTGETGAAFGLLIWAVCAVGLVDNLIGPRLMSRGGSVHPFFILIAVLGGVNLFGPVGLFAGPLIVSFFFALFDAYSNHIQRNQNVIDA